MLEEVFSGCYFLIHSAASSAAAETNT